MANLTFFYNNKWPEQDLEETTQHPNFPLENTILRDFNDEWRTRYGAGSGWGRFTVGAGVKDCIDFDEGGGALLAVITPGTYTADSFAMAVGSAMTAESSAVGYGWTYVCSYDDETNKFTIEETSGPNNFSLSWLTGLSGPGGNGRSAASVLGYSEAADDTGASSYTADYIRIHRSEYARFLRSSTIDVDAIIIRGHNIQSGAVLYFQGSDDNFSTTPVNVSPTIQDNIIPYIWSSTQQRQDWRIWIEDVDNPELFIKIGVVYVGDGFQVVTNFSNQPHSWKPIDLSIEKESEGGQIRTIQLGRIYTKTYVFRVKGLTEIGYFEDMFEAVGTSKALFICEDPDNPLTTTFYCQFTDWEWNVINKSTHYWELSITVKNLA